VTNLIRLLALLSVLLMPFEMAPATAAAHPGAAAAMPAHHCPEQGSQTGSAKGFAECLMACSAALPAAEPAQPHAQLAVCVPIERPLARALTDIHPDIATPPPKQA
jgi:hypothetical protein